MTSRRNRMPLVTSRSSERSVYPHDRVRRPTSHQIHTNTTSATAAMTAEIQSGNFGMNVSAAAPTSTSTVTIDSVMR